MKQTSWTPLIVLLIILMMVWGAWTLGVKAGVEECNRVDDTGKLIYRDSFICATSHGERIKYEGN